MLCELTPWGLIPTWLALSALGLVMIAVMSGSMFWCYYVRPTYERWVHKSNPRFPSPAMVRNEIIQMCKGMLSATFCPALSLYMGQRGLSRAYCGWQDGAGHTYGVVYHVVSFVVLWVACDFYEFFYHRLGHTTASGWQQHKYHHTFWNPSPFAVIADEYLDQFVRAAPLLLFPLVVPINMDMMFFQFGLFFYGYGVYLHWGYELSWPDAHHPVINTAFQHYLHHARSIAGVPYHTGFFFKCWDQLFGSMYTGPCTCAKCEHKAGRRTREQWLALQPLPDYSVLLSPAFWYAGLTTAQPLEPAPAAADAAAAAPKPAATAKAAVASAAISS